MVSKLKDWEKFDRTRSREACREIAASPNLRFFLRQILATCGVDETPYAGNAIETARLCGRQQIGLELKREMQLHLPALSHELEMESYDEIVQRTRNETPPMGRGNGGDSSSYPTSYDQPD